MSIKLMAATAALLFMNLTVALADGGAPGSTSSDYRPKNTKMQFGLGKIKMRDGRIIDFSVGGFQDSTGVQGGTVSVDIRQPTYLNGSLHQDSSRGILLEPGVKARIDSGKRGLLNLADVEVSGITGYRVQLISGQGNDLQLSDEHLKNHMDKVPLYLDALSAYQRCTDYCSVERYQLKTARDDLEAEGIPIPSYKEVNGTFDISIGKATYRYIKNKPLGTSENAGQLEAQISAHGAISIADINIDGCVVAAIGAAAGSFGSKGGDSRGVRLLSRGKGCVGVQVGKLFNARGEIELGYLGQGTDSDASVKSLAYEGKLAEIGGTPLSVGYRYESETASGPGGDKTVNTRILSVQGAF